MKALKPVKRESINNKEVFFFIKVHSPSEFNRAKRCLTSMIELKGLTIPYDQADLLTKFNMRISDDESKKSKKIFKQRTINVI